MLHFNGLAGSIYHPAVTLVDVLWCYSAHLTALCLFVGASWFEPAEG